MCQLPAFKSNTPDALHQHVSARGEKHPELVGPPAVAGRAVAKESELLLLDAVLHFTTSAVDRVIKILRIAFQGSDDKARVLSFFAKLGLGNDAPWLSPGSRRVV